MRLANGEDQNIATHITDTGVDSDHGSTRVTSEATNTKVCVAYTLDATGYWEVHREGGITTIARTIPDAQLEAEWAAVDATTKRLPGVGRIVMWEAHCLGDQEGVKQSPACFPVQPLQNQPTITPLHTAPPSGVHQIGGNVTPPAWDNKVEPVYSAEGKQAKINGNVLVYMIVDTNGRGRNFKVLRGLGHGLDEKAVEAMQASTFHPATENGVPVPVELQVEVNFTTF